MNNLPIIADTLRVDTAVLLGLQQNPDYEYSRDIMNPDTSILELIGRQINKWLSSFFYSEGYETYAPWIYGIFAFVVIVAVGCFLWYRHPGFFRRNRSKSRLAYTIEEDTIYGIDFERVIADATARGDWYEAVRALYLQTLKALSDAGRIDWQAHKTPTQYTKEADNEPFRLLTHHFMRVRYGNFTASHPLFDELLSLQRQVLATQKGGEQ